jgi:hypothetical protein
MFGYLILAKNLLDGSSETYDQVATLLSLA